MKKVSVISINYNSSTSVQRTIDSILSQDYRNVEWIVIDGKSNDESLVILQSVGNKMSFFKSETDRGISHAMNKGLIRATGDIVVFMNAGDAFYDCKSITNAVSTWDYDRYSWVTGGAAVYLEDETHLYDRVHVGTTWEKLLKQGCRIFHASTFIKRSVLVEHGGFSEAFKSSMDYDLWLKLASKSQYPQIISPIISKFYLGGTSASLLRRYREDRLARKNNGIYNCWRELISMLLLPAKVAIKSMPSSKVLYQWKEAIKL